MEVLLLRDEQTINIASDSVTNIRGGIVPQIRSFFNIVQKVGGSNPCSKILEQILYDLKAFWQHKIDTKRLFKGRNVSNWG